MSARVADASTWDAEVLSADGPVLVDFWAPWCGPCRALSPILDEIAAENPGRITIVKVNIDENPSLALKYRIASIPALRVFVDGEVDKVIVGAKPKPILEAELAAYLG